MAKIKTELRDDVPTHITIHINCYKCICGGEPVLWSNRADDRHCIRCDKCGKWSTTDEDINKIVDNWNLWVKVKGE